jgi:phosphatidate cytidylyltransferase
MPADDTDTRGGAGRVRVAGRRRAREAADTPVADSTPTPSDGTSDGTVANGNSAAPPADGETPRRSRAGRNLPAAIGVAVGLAAVIITTLFAYRPSFVVLVGIVIVYACYELTVALKAQGVRAALVPIEVGTVAMLVSAWTRGADGLVVALLLTVLAVAVWRLAEGAQDYLRDVGASVLVVLYVPALAGFAVLSAHPHDGAARIITMVATVACSDTGGYATGVFFGRHPLAPIISKAKTWEGFAGSVVACSTAGILIVTLTFHRAWWQGLLFGLAIVVTATLGDLGESMIKRDLGIKDMGRLLPGHGGVMDRLDSMLPCAAVAYLILSGIAPV